MYNFVLLVQKEISPTPVKKINFDHLIILIKFNMAQWLELSVGDREVVSSIPIFSNVS